MKTKRVVCVLKRVRLSLCYCKARVQKCFPKLLSARSRKSVASLS